jgi:hypothetical protein
MNDEGPLRAVLSAEPSAIAWRAGRSAIIVQAPASPAPAHVPHVQARHVPITQFGIQQIIIGLALAAARNGGSGAAWLAGLSRVVIVGPAAPGQSA